MRVGISDHGISSKTFTGFILEWSFFSVSCIDVFLAWRRVKVLMPLALQVSAKASIQRESSVVFNVLVGEVLLFQCRFPYPI